MVKLSRALLLLFLVGPFVSLAGWIWAVMSLWNTFLTWTVGSIFLLVGMIIWLGATIVWLAIVVVAEKGSLG